MRTDKVLEYENIVETWSGLSEEEHIKVFRSLTRDRREDLFLDLQPADQVELLLTFPEHEQRTYMRVLPPDDAADVIQNTPEEERTRLLGLLDDTMRREVVALLVYAEDDAGGLMSPRFARLRPDMTVDEAISYLRLQGRRLETIIYAYVLDYHQHLLGVVSFRDLFVNPGNRRVSEIMERQVVSVAEDLDQEEVARLFALHDLVAIPVVDEEGRVKGIVTVDDIVDVVHEEASEDIQKIGGMEALEAPYMDTSTLEMLRKRGGWLTLLFLGGMLTAKAMEHFQGQITQAVVLVVFLPLIIASGGNSGTQASTLTIRALALGEIRLGDWWRVFRREIVTSLLLGLLLSVIGWLRVLGGEWLGEQYGEHYLLLGLTVGASLVGVVVWGSLVGATLPFLLQRVGVDPAGASGPLVSTLVDATGIIIYFNVAHWILSGSLLGPLSG